MKNIKNTLSVLALLVAFTFLNAQSTYTVGSTKYVYGEYYSTTGQPKVVRSYANKKAFLRSRGYSDTPPGYEIDHIIPLSQGGSDAPYNMQLLTVRQHKAKTARESAYRSTNYYYYKPLKDNYYSVPKFNSTSTTPSYYKPSYSIPSYSSNHYSIPSVSSRVIHTGSRGGRYYINSNGNKTYLKN